MENTILLDLCVYVEHEVGPTLADIIMKLYTCLSLNPFICLLYFMCISHYKSSLHTFRKVNHLSINPHICSSLVTQVSWFLHHVNVPSV